MNHESAFSRFDSLHVIGHSLGGGLGMLFGLESILKRFVPTSKCMKVVTFGAPVVISYENSFDSLSRGAKKILAELHSICHCFVNRFDPVPRIPARIEWMMTVIPYALKKIIAQQLKNKMNLPGFLISFVKSGVKSGVSKYVGFVEKYVDLIQSYHPFGTFYFFAARDCDEAYVTKNPAAIQQMLGFMPPHKITASDKQELRVSHYSAAATIVKMPQNSRFSLAHITQWTSNENEENEQNDFVCISSENEKREKNSNLVSIVERSKSIKIEKCENDKNKNALYVTVESDDEEIQKAWRAKKMSPDGWVMLVSNHMMSEYIDLFTAKVQLKKSKYPLLPPSSVISPDYNYFAASHGKEIEKEINCKQQTQAVSTTDLLKSTGKKWWNQAKDQYQKQKDDFFKHKQNENINDPQTAAVSPYPYPSQLPSYQQQPILYVQQPQNLSASGQMIGNTQYRIAQQNSHFVVYPQQQQQQQTQTHSQSSAYPSLSKKY